MTQKGKYAKQFSNHRYWRYSFSEGEVIGQIILMYLFKKGLGKYTNNRYDLTPVTTKECLLISDTEVEIDKGDVWIKFPLDKGDSLTPISHEQYQFFRNLGKEQNEF